MRGLAFALALLAGVIQASAAFGHASLVRSEPSDGAMLRMPPAVLSLTFNEPVSPLIVRLIGPSGQAMAPAFTVENTTIIITPPRLGNGTHALSWRVVSADGHPVGGSLVFSVGAPSSAPAGVAGVPLGDRGVRLALWAAKLVIYIGLFVGVGGAFFRAWIAEPGTPSAGSWIMASLAAGLVAVPISVGLQGLDALDLPLSDLAGGAAWRAGFETAYGATAAAAVLALVGAMLAGMLLGRSSVSAQAARVLSLAGLIGIGFALSLSGHASTAEPRLLTRSCLVLHGICLAFWIGAFAPLIAALHGPERGRATFARFTWLIPYPLTLLLISGAVLAFVQLGRMEALWTTPYGLVLAGKLVAVSVMLVLAAGNRFMLVPRIAAAVLGRSKGGPPDGVPGSVLGVRGLRRSIAAELVIATAIFGLVACWRFTPPPRALAAVEQVSLHLHGARAMAQIEITPEGARGLGANVLVLDPELRPLAVKQVTLAFSNPAAGIEAFRRRATANGDGAWRLDDVRIPVAGRWQIRAEILVNDFEMVTLDDEAELPRAP